jgi:hypothetical protein
MSPLARDLELQGVNRMQFMQSLVGAHKYFLEKPREAALWVLNQYGVDPKSPGGVFGRSAIGSRRPAFSEARNDVQRAHRTAAAAPRTNRTSVGCNQFAAAKDDKGQPLHPFFDEASGEILALMKATPGLISRRPTTRPFG